MEKTLARSALPLVAALLVAATAAAGQGAPVPATVSGQVREVGTNTPIAGATVAIPELRRAAVTDQNGRFSFAGLPSGVHEWTISALGFVAVRDRMETEDGDRFTVGMMAEPVEVEGVTVSAPTIDRYFAERMTRGGGGVRLYKGAELVGQGAPSIEQFVMSKAQVKPCTFGETGWRLIPGVAVSETVCVYSHGRYTPVYAIWVDGRRAMGGVLELSAYQPHEIYAIEISEGGRRINAYTLRYAERLARGQVGQPANSPIN